MTVVNASQVNQESLSRWTPERLAWIIDKLAAGKSNLRVDFGDVKFTIGNQEYEFSGDVDFNVIHEDDGNAGYPASDYSDQGNEGIVHVSTGDVEVLRINAKGKRLDVDVEDKQFLKRVIKMRGELAPNAQENKKKKSGSPLAMARKIADTCKKMGITMTVSYRGHLIATMGADAKPMLLQYVTKTHALALNSLYTAMELMI